MRAAGTAFDKWRETTPSERQRALLRFADAVEARAEELAEAESRNTGKLVPLVLSEEIPPMVDQIRFFAGAARVLEAGGWLAFTAEAAADDDAAFVLQPSLRYAHGEQGLRRLAAGHGFVVEELLRAPLREDQGRPVDGLYALWRRRP
jgi:predicted TPR repeat methyltransferase